MKLFVTVAEATADDALAAIRRITLDHDGVELRAERFRSAALHPFRASTSKLLLYTVRGEGPIAAEEVARAIDAGFDLVDVEWSPALAPGAVAPFRDRIVISHHDYEGMRDIEAIATRMRALGCAHVKIAATPQSLRDNLALLALADQTTSVIGMGERGIYTRIAAPFLGSALTFVAPDPRGVAAPGQVTLERALAIYGDARETLSARHLFAVAGNPASHSLSPSIHNPLFRERGADAAYTIASAADFSEVAELIDGGQLTGVSVTAPFKEAALQWAIARGYAIGENARLCGAANTIVAGALRVADNTDVDGFVSVLETIEAAGPLAIVGAGGTARAALVAARKCGREAIVFNRGADRAASVAAEFGVRSETLEALRHFAGNVVIDTTPSADFAISFHPAMTYLRAAYGAASPVEQRARDAGATVIDGLRLLHAQALRQNELFLEGLR